MVNYPWIIADPAPSKLAESFPEMHPVILQLLHNRSITSQNEVDVFFGPDWDRDTHPPSAFTKMPQAVKRTFEALEKGESIVIHGDYDADGVCGTSVLFVTLRDICRQMGFDCSKITTYIPHREREGYGVSTGTVKRLIKDREMKLLITVDCGISNFDAVAKANELGVEVIITDHHEVPENAPEAILIHPQAKDETYPYKQLCGAGVAFKFAHGLLDEARKQGAAFHEGYEKWLLDFVAVATVTDIMPLTGENRVLEKYGLLVLNKTRRIGLQKLIDVAGGKMGELDTISIGFQIGPRLNAAGRMRHADIALELMIEEDENRANELAGQLQSINTERQKTSEAMFQQAVRQVEKDKEEVIIIVEAEGWSAGLVGLVAGKLVQRFGRPAFVVGKEGEAYVGSGRSVGGFHMVEALQAVAEHLEKFGGHPQACGFSVRGKENFEKAAEGLQAFAREQIADKVLVPPVEIESELLLRQIDWDFYAELEKFAPFGQANSCPIFCTSSVRIISLGAVGAAGKHLRMMVQDAEGNRFKVIGFKFGDWIEQLHPGSEIDIAFELSVNEWNNNRELQLVLKDLKLKE
jgi:single-stranded-DNA-specific exonuclease